MIFSACVFGYGPVGQEVVSRISKLEGYGDYLRVHIVIVKDLTETPDAVFNSAGQWKLLSHHPEDPDLSISIGDDIEWLESEGYRGHDVVIDCSSSEEDFSKEVSAQMELNKNFLLYKCNDLAKVDDLMATIKTTISKKSGNFISDYNLTLLNRTNFYKEKEFSSEKLLDTDPDRIYENNEFQFRQSKEIELTDILFAGCSVTYGVGISLENIWGNVLAKKLNLTATNLSKPGASIEQIVGNVFRYFKNYGHPKYLFCLLPDYGRYFFPVDGKFYKTKDMNNPPAESGSIQNGKSFFQTIHLEVDYEDAPQKYIKLPYDYKKILSPDMYLHEAIKNIRFLEQYCKATGIKLLWSTWDRKLQEIAEHAQNYNETKFDYFFSCSDFYRYWNRGVESREDVFFSEQSDLDVCIFNHKGKVCSCGDNCHEELRESYPKEFYSGTDTKHVDGKMQSHYGAHWHRHTAEAFYSKIMELNLL